MITKNTPITSANLYGFIPPKDKFNALGFRPRSQTVFEGGSGFKNVQNITFMGKQTGLVQPVLNNDDFIIVFDNILAKDDLIALVDGIVFEYMRVTGDEPFVVEGGYKFNVERSLYGTTASDFARLSPVTILFDGIFVIVSAEDASQIAEDVYRTFCGGILYSEGSDSFVYNGDHYRLSDLVQRDGSKSIRGKLQFEVGFNISDFMAIEFDGDNVYIKNRKDKDGNIRNLHIESEGEVRIKTPQGVNVISDYGAQFIVGETAVQVAHDAVFVLFESVEHARIDRDGLWIRGDLNKLQ